MKTSVATLLACLALATATTPSRAAQNIIDVTITDDAFEPAQVKAGVGVPFTLRFHNQSKVPAEVESHDLKFEKVVPAGADIIVKVRPKDAGDYEYFNDFKPAVKGQVVIGE